MTKVCAWNAKQTDFDGAHGMIQDVDSKGRIINSSRHVKSINY